MIAVGGWVAQPDGGYYLDPVSGKIFIRRFAAIIQRNRDHIARKALRETMAEAARSR